MTNHAEQREADAAFFEDWREWRDLGGWPEYTSYPIGKRRTNMLHYHCTLDHRTGFLGGRPAFEVAIPKDARCDRLIRSVPDVIMYPRSRTRDGNVVIWFVPAHRWQELRCVLPRIKAIVTEICNR